MPAVESLDQVLECLGFGGSVSGDEGAVVEDESVVCGVCQGCFMDGGGLQSDILVDFPFVSVVDEDGELVFFEGVGKGFLPAVGFWGVFSHPFGWRGYFLGQGGFS